MSDEEELSEDELNALISDLESRSDGGGGEASADLDDEAPEGDDLDALLQDVDEEAAEPAADPKVAEREGPDGGPDLSDLEVDDELPVETDESKPGPDTDAAKTEASPESSPEADEQPAATEETSSEPSKIWTYLWMVAKWTGYALPVVAFWWMLGSYLGQWISAGWLIALVSTMAVAGIPKLLYDLADRRGRFRWWLAGASLVLTMALVAPMSDSAGEALTNYGHWPATTAAEITGSPAGFWVDTNATIGEWIGRTLHPGLPAEEGMRELGQ